MFLCCPFKIRPSSSRLAVLTVIPRIKIMAPRRSRAERLSSVFVILSIFLVASSFTTTTASTSRKTRTLGLRIQRERNQARQPQTLQMRLTHSKAHALPDTKLPTFRDIVRSDRRRLGSRQTAARALLHNGPRGGAETLAGGAARGSIGTPLASQAPAGESQYVVELGFGAQASKSLLVVDTGSDLLWTKCQYRSSGQQNTNGSFNADGSSSFEPIKCNTDACKYLDTSGCSRRLQGLCGYNYTYVDGSGAVGILSYDTVTLNGVPITDIAFGCTDIAQGDSVSLSQGVLGLGADFVSFSSQLSELYGAKFSYCFIDHITNPTASNSLVFGSRQLSKREQQQIRSTPLVRNPQFPGFYYAAIESLSVDGKVLSIPANAWEIRSDGGGGTVLDTGTSLSYLVEPAFGALRTAFDKLLPYPRVSNDLFPLCFKNAGVNRPYPQLVINFQGSAPFQPPANNYISEVESGVSCLAFVEAVGQYASNVIGNILQQNFVVEYDRGNSQLRFAPTDCSKN